MPTLRSSSDGLKLRTSLSQKACGKDEPYEESPQDGAFSGSATRRPGCRPATPAVPLPCPACRLAGMCGRRCGSILRCVPAHDDEIFCAAAAAALAGLPGVEAVSLGGSRAAGMECSRFYGHRIRLPTD